MNKKFLLSTVFMLMSWQGIFAGAPEFSGTPEGPVKPRVSMTEQPQGALVGNMIPDTMGRILVNLPFKDGWVFLSAKKTHRNHGEVWEIFGGIHGISLTKDEDTAEKIRGKIIQESQETLLAAVPLRGDSFTSDIMINLLENVQEKPFLWGSLLNTLPGRLYPKISIDAGHRGLNSDAYYGSLGLKGVSETSRRAYLVAVSLLKNPDGTPSVSAKDAQKMLNKAAYSGKLGFTPGRGTSTSGYDYLVRVAARKNLDETPGLGAKNAQKHLKRFKQD